MENNILMRSIPIKNKLVQPFKTFGIIIIPLSLFVCLFTFCTHITWSGRSFWEIYNGNILEFFFDKFFDEYIYSYMFLTGIGLLTASIIIKRSTENTVVTVCSNIVYGKKGSKPEMQIPLHMITGIKSYGSYGVAILSYNTIYRFPCIKNRDEIIRIISQLLTSAPGKMPQIQPQSAPVISRSNSTSDFD